MQVTAVKNYGKTTGTSGRLIKAVYASYVCVHVSCTSQSGRLEAYGILVGKSEGKSSFTWKAQRIILKWRLKQSVGRAWSGLV